MKTFFKQFYEALAELPGPILAAVKIFCILLIAFLVIKIGSFIIKKTFQKQKLFKYALDQKKIDTMATLLVSAYKYSIYIIVLVIVLSDVFKLSSILAAAGVGGVAVGLGAQSLIKDVISGFFIVMEDQFGVGDVISVDSLKGTVEKLELRVTRLRNEEGDIHIIPNGEIKRVTNHSRR